MLRKAVRTPSIRQPNGSNTADVVGDIVKWVQTREGVHGDGLDRVVTLRDLAALQLADERQLSGRIPGNPVPPPPDPAGEESPIPPTPFGLTASGTPTAILLQWNMPPYGRMANYEVWRSGTNNLGDAVLLAAPTAQLWYDPVGPGETWYYWVRAKSNANQYSPYNAVTGTVGSSGYLAADLVAALAGQITTSTLSTALAGEIALISAPSTTPGSVNSRLSDLQGQIDVLAAASGGDLSDVLAALSTETAARIAGDAAEAAARTTAIASLNTSLTSVQAAVTTETAARVSGDNALAGQISTVQTSVNGNTSSIQSLTLSVNGLSSRYTVKIDTNGYVSGFGLASENNNGTVVSTFLIRADSFAIASPSGPGITPRVPFIVRTTPTNIGGVTIPAGVYMDTAVIQDLSVDSAKIVSLVANKITAGFINAAIGLNGASVFGARLYSGGTTTVQTDPNGNVTGFVANNPTFRVEEGVVTINAASFRVFNGSSADVPFEVVGGVTRLRSAMIGAATIGSAQIANILQSTNYVPGVSGWLIDRSGYMELLNLYARGSLNGGAYTGYAWPASGGGFHLGPNGLLLGNNNVGPGYFQVTASGDVYAPNFTIISGAATFGGNLAAAGGTFSGVLTASAVNAVNTINIADDAVIVPASAELTVPVQPASAGAWVDLVTTTPINPRTGKVFIVVNALYSVGTGQVPAGGGGFQTQTYQPSFRVVRNIAAGGGVQVGNIFGGGNRGLRDAPGDANHTYTVQVRDNTQATGIINVVRARVSDCSIIVIGAKK